MAKLIERIHLTLADLEGKNVATKRPPEQVDRVLYLIIVDLFNKHIDHYVKTSKVSNYLLPFKRKASVALTSGQGELPPDFAHQRAVYAGGKEVPVIEDKFWNHRVNSKLSPVSATNPICRIENEPETPRRIQFAPNISGPVELLYFKYPTAPKYAYVTNGTRYLYDEESSIDVEFPIGLFPEIVNRLMGAFGINLRDGQLIQISEQLKTQEQAK